MTAAMPTNAIPTKPEIIGFFTGRLLYVSSMPIDASASEISNSGSGYDSAAATLEGDFRSESHARSISHGKRHALRPIHHNGPASALQHWNSRGFDQRWPRRLDGKGQAGQADSPTRGSAIDSAVVERERLPANAAGHGLL